MPESKPSRCSSPARILQLVEADGMIWGSAVYPANVSDNMQAFLERVAVVSDLNSGLLTHKVGALPVFGTMNRFFLHPEMFAAGSTC